MACISVLVGQCGNQLGTAVFETLAREAQRSDDDAFQSQVSSTYFRPPEEHPLCSPLPLPRSLLVDMESKVIDKCIHDSKGHKLFQVSRNQCITKDEGSGNNWAFGFSHQGPSKEDDIIESIRRELEVAGTVGSFNIVHSLAGGTGSGVGCFISQCIRDCFTRKIIHHSVVAPFSHGEVATQWYNSTMAFACLHETADSIAILSNDEISLAIERKDFFSSSSSRTHTGKRQAPTCSLDDINKVMGSILGAIMLPSNSVDIPEIASSEKRASNPLFGRNRVPQQLMRKASINLNPASLQDVVETVAVDPSRKFMECLSFPLMSGSLESNMKQVSWQSTINSALRVVSAMRYPGSRYAMYLRGETAYDLDNGGGYGELPHSLFSVPNAGAPDGIFLSDSSFNDEKAHVTLLHTSRSVGNRIAFSTKKAEKMFKSKAFMHHFERYGIEDDSFRASLAISWHLARCYNADVICSSDENEASESDDSPLK
eukprot:Tbor_TRINITY_DN7524_c0_g1::TRINITY_DN7524_c0_g1_i1::g.891::m.891/K10390/TUBD; tubulin delta